MSENSRQLTPAERARVNAADPGLAAAVQQVLTLFHTNDPAYEGENLRLKKRIREAHKKAGIA